jgi:tetratricopeptide (TPR) repeat protein
VADVDTVETRLQRRLQQQTTRCTSRALRIYTPMLRDYARRSQTPDTIDSFISILRNAVSRSLDDHDALLSYTHALVELLANVGGGSQFRAQEALLDTFEGVASQLYDGGCSTTDLRLMMARYCAAISNGGERRLRLIELAVRESRDDDERLRAVLVMAKYYIDVSEYDTGHRYLDDCLQLADRAATGEAQRYDISTTRGIAYFYRDHALAARFLRMGIEPNPDVTDPVICRSSASALHYLGRIKAAAGDHVSAVDLIVLAQHFKDRVWREGTQFGYYHLRLGEVLTSAGDRDAAMWHLEQAGKIFHEVRERSNAEAYLNSVLAGLAAARGEHDQAVQLLTRAVETTHSDRYPRGELLFRYQLTILHLRRASLISAIAVALPAVKLLRSSQIGGLRWIAKQIRTRRFPRRTTQRSQGVDLPLVCPCPDHGAVPEETLLTRANLGQRC